MIYFILTYPACVMNKCALFNISICGVCGTNRTFSLINSLFEYWLYENIVSNMNDIGSNIMSHG